MCAERLAGQSIQRWGRPIALGLSLLFVAFGGFVLWTIFATNEAGPGSDREIYVGAAHRWLAGTFVYYPEQLAGPYELAVGHVLYPPIALLGFASISALPVVLWWAIPLATIGAVIVYHRPAWWARPIIAACLAFQWSVMLVYAGNPTIWFSAAAAVGTIVGWPAVAVLLKPTLFPFALIGADRRSWWLALVLVVVLSVPFGTMWVDWFHAVTNAHGWRVGLLYSLGDVPLMLAPLVAWFGTTRRRATSPEQSRSRPDVRKSTSAPRQRATRSG